MFYFTQNTAVSMSKCLCLKLALVLSLTLTSWTVTAEQSTSSVNNNEITGLNKDKKSFTAILNHIASIASDMTDPIEVNEHWTRIDLDIDFINPVIIPDIETINSTTTGAFMLGIRNADANGFEVRLEWCQQSSSMQSPEVVYIAILESGEYSTSDGVQVQVKQRFSWGQCKVPLQQPTIS
ncbi:MAG: hypothetical protein ACKE51_07400 [Methylococcaceae bacterium]